MKTFKIRQNLGNMGIFYICDWQADTPQQAVKDFIEKNPKYANGKKGYILAFEKGAI